MAKAKRNNNKQGKKKRSTGRVRKRVPAGMDAAAMAYAKLLLDPCRAPLVKPLYGSSGSGYLVRVQSTKTWTIADSGGSLSVMYAPGQISSATEQVLPPSASVGAILSCQSGSLIGGGTGYRVYNHTTVQPGYSFFDGLSGSVNVPNVSVRPVASCMRARYLGTELNRSGAVYTGYLPQSESYFSVNPPLSGDVGAAFNANLATAAQYTSRTPDGSVEVRWAPNRADMRFRDVDTAVGTPAVVDQPSHAGMFVNFSGMATGSVIEVTFTTVYEWVPNSSQGFVMPTDTVHTISNMDAVLGYLRSFGNWFTSDAPLAGMLRNAAVRYATGAAMSGGTTRQLARIEL